MFVGRTLAFVMSTVKKYAKPQVVFVLGGPGAGKGTNCGKIVRDFGFVHLSAGDLLRAEVQSGSQHGQMINDMMKAGEIVPAKVTIGLLDAAIQKSSTQLVLIDGFPRNQDNRDQWIDMMNDKVDVRYVLFIDCPDEVQMDRLLRRSTESNRVDDNVESIKKRFKVYHSDTMPVIEWYAKQDKVRKIDGSRAADTVYADVRQLFRQEFDIEPATTST